MPRVSIIGTTSWGMTLGTVLAKKGFKVEVWARTKEEASALLNGKLKSNGLPLMNESPLDVQFATNALTHLLRFPHRLVTSFCHFFDTTRKLLFV